MKTSMLLLLAAVSALTGCATFNQPVANSRDLRLGDVVVLDNQPQFPKLGDGTSLGNEKAVYEVKNGSWLMFVLSLKEQGKPVSGALVKSSSEDTGGVRKQYTGPEGMVALQEPVGGEKSSLGPITKVIENASMRFTTEGAEDVVVKFRLLPASAPSAPPLAVATPQPVAQLAQAPVVPQAPQSSTVAPVIVRGAEKRVKVVAKYLRDNGGVFVEEYTDEVIGTLNSKPWPGVQVTTGGASDAGVFVPVSDTALEKGLCADQKRLLGTFVSSPQPAAVTQQSAPQLAVSPPPAPNDVRFCDSLQTGNPSPPYKVVTNHPEEVILNHPGDKVVISFWVEDSKGRKVGSPSWRWVVEDGTFMRKFPTTITITCGDESHTKVWDNDPKTGRPWTDVEVRGQFGAMVFGVTAETPVTSATVPWRVSP